MISLSYIRAFLCSPYILEQFNRPCVRLLVIYAMVASMASVTSY